MSNPKIAQATSRAKKSFPAPTAAPPSKPHPLREIGLYLSSRAAEHPDRPQERATKEQYFDLFAVVDAAFMQAAKGAKTGDGYMQAVASLLCAVRHGIHAAKDETALVLLVSKLIEHQATAYSLAYVERAHGEKAGASRG